MTLPGIQPEPGSFQDRDNRIFYHGHRVLRVLGQEAFAHWEMLSACRFFQSLSASNKLIPTAQVNDVPLPGLLANRPEAAVLEHRKIPLISYPYEWCFSMLKDAALLQLELLQHALGEQMILKDASPFNIQWLGSQPIFIDVLSFEPLPPGRPWMAAHQFNKLYLYPLLLQAYKKVPFQPWLKGSLGGIEPEDFQSMLSLFDYLRPGILTEVALPTLFQHRFSRFTRPDEAPMEVLQSFQNLGDTHVLIQKHVSRLQNLLKDIRWTPAVSAYWQDYATMHTYSHDASQAKVDFVTQVAQSRHWDSVWDIGCNTGQYSEIAARHANFVVALDADQASIETLYQRLKQQENSKILPLVFNLAEPSPGLGWNGSERHPLTKRGKPELVLCLALVHHMVIHHNIPMNVFIQWLGNLKADLVIEFVSREDPMVLHLLQNRIDQYTDYDQAYFESCLKTHFEIRQTLALDGETRTLYHAVPLQE